MTALELSPPVPGRSAVPGAGAALVFALLTWQVAGHGPWWRGDVRADAAVLRAAHRHPSLAPPAQVLADLGGPSVALPLLVVVLAVAAWRFGQWRRAAGYAGVMAAAGAVVVPVKALVARPAPGAVVLAGHSGYFPSGHAATAAVASGLAVLALRPALGTPAARRLVVLAAVLLNLAVGAALVWRGYHWPSDVLASWCLAGVLLCLARGVTSWWGTRG